jgi:hypothetical protein
MTFYTISQLGPTRHRMPNGYLICLNVPIARTGQLVYRSAEVGIPGNAQGLVYIQRDPEEVFAPDAMASFNGVSITDDHPPVSVSSKNSRSYAMGQVQNIRRGSGSQSDLLLADFVISDEDLIGRILKGKVEVSCGYDCDYEITGPGRGRQVDIVGNHVALVKKGRCGPRCAIGDSAMAFRKKINGSLRKKITLASQIRSAFENDDGDALEAHLAALDDDPEMDGQMMEQGDAGASPGNINIHYGAKGMPALDMADISKMIGDAMKPITDSVKALDAKVDGMMTKYEIQPPGKIAKRSSASDTDQKAAKDALDAAQAAYDAAWGKEDDDEDTKKKAKMAKDSAVPSDLEAKALDAAFKAAFSLAEILAPGMRIPTFDAAASLSTSTDALCNFRRRALQKAMDEKATFDIIKPLTGDSLDVMQLSCDQAATTFIGAAEMVRLARRTKPAMTGDQRGGLTFHAQKAPMTPAEMNKRNREFAEKKRGVLGG